MTKDIYAVWDFESGNILHAYDTEEDVFDLVRRQLDACAPDAVRHWGISRERRGRLSPIAQGDALIARARQGRKNPLRATGT
ncbi:MAG: hypothetical protein ACRDJE_08405 [Dehalococcoidia bacterium]